MAKISMGNAGDKLKAAMAKNGEAVKSAMRDAADATAQAIEQRGRANISAGGNFGGRWTDAFRTEVADAGSSIKIDVMMGGDPPVAYWKVFEFGADISAKNPSGLMWIPADRENTTWPRDQSEPMFRAKNTLFSVATKEPMYFGTPQVHIPQKWQLRDIIKNTASELREFYKVSISKFK